MHGNCVAYYQGKLGASAERGSNEEVPLDWENRDNLPAIRGGQEHRSAITVKLHHDNTGRVLDGVSPGRPADVVNSTGAASAVAEANWLPKVGCQHQTGTNAYEICFARLPALSSGAAAAPGPTFLTLIWTTGRPRRSANPVVSLHNDDDHGQGYLLQAHQELQRRLVEISRESGRQSPPHGAVNDGRAV